MIRQLGAILSTAVFITSSTAHAQTDCISEKQANALFVAVLPGVVEALGTQCQAHLPSDARLLNSTETLETSYKPASEAAWPNATEAFAALLGAKMPKGLDTGIIAPIAGAFTVAAIAEKIDTSDCPVAEKVYAALEPLPPQNIASLLVTLIQQADSRTDSKEETDDGPPFDICPAQPEL